MCKKVLIILVLLAMPITGLAAARWSINQDNYTSNPLGLLRNRFGILDTEVAALQAQQNQGTGGYYYVDSGAGSDSYAGTSWTLAKATIDAAIGLCTANNGDVIYVAQGHAENIASAAALDCDVAGITIIGIGSGDDMPELALTAQASTVEIAAADVTIQNIRFLGNYTNGVTECIDVTATGDGARILECEFRETANTKELLKMITLTADADRCVIYGNRFLGEAGGTDSSAIFAEGGTDKTIIAGNTFIGDWSGYVVDATTAASTELAIYGNYVHNADTTAGKTMAVHDSATGGVFANVCYGNGASFAFSGNAVFVSPDNVFSNAEAVEPTVTYLDHLDTILADTSAQDTEAEWADLGSTLVDNTVSAIDANGLSYWREKVAVHAGTNNCSSEDLFDVAGGPILITDFTCYVTETVDSNAATCKIIVDRDDGAADTEFTTAVNVETDTLGTVWIFTAANPAVLTPLTPGANGSSNLMSPWFCPEGMIETVFSAANLDGSVTYYMTYIPLAAGVTVTSQ